MRTIACWKRRDDRNACTVACGKARVIRRRLHCLNSRTERCSHVPATTRGGAIESRRIMWLPLDLSIDGRTPMRRLNGPNGAPTSRYFSSCSRTWDHLRGASPMVTEPS